jgi:hypothetical protein
MKRVSLWLRLRFLIALALSLVFPGSAYAANGTWQVLPSTVPVRSVHATVMHDGEVFLMAGSGNSLSMFKAGTFKTAMWNPVTNTFTSIPAPYDLFCAGHIILPDGNLLIAGGTASYPAMTGSWHGTPHATIFSLTRYLAGQSPWVSVPDMHVGRWYPTLVETGNGQALTVSGNDQTGVRTPLAEMFDPGQSLWSVLPIQRSWPNYPTLLLLADGRLFYTGSAVGLTASSRYQPGIWNYTTGAFQKITGLPYKGNRDQSSSVLLPPAQNQDVMIFGGGITNPPAGYTNPIFGDTSPAINQTALIDLSNPSTAKYVAGPQMQRKMDVTAVVLPDKTVLVTNGGLFNRTTPAYGAEIYHPTTNTIEEVASPTVARLYHSEAVLLPDGSVATFGSNPAGGSFNYQIEEFHPWYMQPGVVRPAAPTLPQELNHGVAYDVPPGETFELLAPNSVTHSTDTQQREVDLPVSNGQAVVPPNPNILPPGWYMAFALKDGTPSVAEWVHVNNP